VAGEGNRPGGFGNEGTLEPCRSPGLFTMLAGARDARSRPDASRVGAQSDADGADAAVGVASRQ